MKTPEILYEDNHVIVVVKPANIAVQADSSGDEDMLTLLKAYIKEKYHKEGNVYLGLVHRLDRPVGGVMVFARTSKAAGRLSNAFAQHKVNKRYAAAVCGTPDKGRDRLTCYMRKDEKTFSSEVCKETDNGAKLASLDYICVARRSGVSLLDIVLNTGRHHQIRLQLMSEGMPIYADHRYNPEFINDNTTDIALFAYSLEFPHPITKENMCFCALPHGGVWTGFMKELRLLAVGVTPVYMDDNIIVCDKPCGVSVAMADGDENTIEERMSRAEGYARPVHRLDATTEGLVAFATNERSYELLCDAFSRHGEYIHKFYTCTVCGTVIKGKTNAAYLTKNEELGKVSVDKNESAGAKKIITRYRPISNYEIEDTELSVLEVELVTGRTHQIRAHLAYLGYPILGDDKYGDRGINKLLHTRTPRLRSERITFNFPVGHELEYLNHISIGDIL